MSDNDSVCVSVCMYVCPSVCVCVCMCVSILCVCVYVCAYVSVCVLGHVFGCPCPIRLLVRPSLFSPPSAPLCTCGLACLIHIAPSRVVSL